MEGHGLALFQALFPIGEVTGVDRDTRWHWPEGVRQVVAEQTDPRLPELLGGPFDLIADDASHIGSQTGHTFAMLWPLVAPGGYYVIEDWHMNQPGMRDTVAGLLGLLTERDSECDEIRCRFGLAVVHKRKEPVTPMLEPRDQCWPQGACESPFHDPRWPRG
jgi:hypothetical protein